MNQVEWITDWRNTVTGIRFNHGSCRIRLFEEGHDGSERCFDYCRTRYS